MQKIWRRLTGFGIAAGSALGASVMLAAPAQATAGPGVSTCTIITYNGGACLFYNSNFNGSLFTFSTNISDLKGYEFSTIGSSRAGIGTEVKNNSASVYNNSAACLLIFYNSGYKGAFDVVLPHSSLAQLSATYNNDASVEFVPPIDC